MAALMKQESPGFSRGECQDLTVTQLKVSLLVSGPTDGSMPNWDTSWRLLLVCQAEVMINQLFSEGIEAVYLDGSFAERKG